VKKRATKKKKHFHEENGVFWWGKRGRPSKRFVFWQTQGAKGKKWWKGEGTNQTTGCARKQGGVRGGGKTKRELVFPESRKKKFGVGGPQSREKKTWGYSGLCANRSQYHREPTSVKILTTAGKRKSVACVAPNETTPQKT